MDLKLKDLLGSINVSQKIRIVDIDDKENFYPTYRELDNYKDYYVTDIYAYAEDNLAVKVKKNI